MSDLEDRFRPDVDDHRRRARILALQALFQIDVGGQSTEAAILDVLAKGEESGVKAFVQDVVRGVREDLEALDRLIQGRAQNWTLERMARVDRNILRLGAFELLRKREVPAAVVIDEAVELAKEYGDEGSGGFVNGILDSIRQTEVKSE